MFTRLVAYLQSNVAHDESGASLVEYAILVALIAVAAIAAVQILSGRINQTFTDITIP